MRFQSTDSNSKPLPIDSSQSSSDGYSSEDNTSEKAFRQFEHHPVISHASKLRLMKTFELPRLRLCRLRSVVLEKKWKLWCTDCFVTFVYLNVLYDNLKRLNKNLFQLLTCRYSM